MYALAAVICGRGDDVRNLFMSDLCAPKPMPTIGPAGCMMQMILARGGKTTKVRCRMGVGSCRFVCGSCVSPQYTLPPLLSTTQAGGMEHLCFIRHSDAACCALGALAIMWSHMYDVAGAPFPDTSTDEGLEEL